MIYRAPKSELTESESEHFPLLFSKLHTNIQHVVVVVVMTSPSGAAYMGGQMSRRDEEFHQTLNLEGPSLPRGS